MESWDESNKLQWKKTKAHALTSPVATASCEPARSHPHILAAPMVPRAQHGLRPVGLKVLAAAERASRRFCLRQRFTLRVPTNRCGELVRGGSRAHYRLDLRAVRAHERDGKRVSHRLWCGTAADEHTLPEPFYSLSLD